MKYVVKKLEDSIKVTGIVNNTHLCGFTTEDDIKKGSKLAHELAEATGLPLICSTAPKAIADKLFENEFAEPLFAIDIHMKKPWE